MYTIRIYKKDTNEEWVFMRLEDRRTAREIKESLTILYRMEDLQDVRGVYIDIE